MTNNNLTIALRGEMTKNGIDMYSLGNTLINSHSLFDRTYSYYSGYKRLSSIERNNYKLLATEIHRGSIIIDTELILHNVQQVLPFVVGNLSPQLVIETTFTAFKYLYELLSNFRKNTPKETNIIDSPYSVVYQINGDNNTINVSPSVHSIAKSYRPIARRLSETFKSGATGEIEISSGIHPNKISITDKNAVLFQSQKIISENHLSLTGVVRSYYSEKFSGHFYVLPGMAIPEGKYPFTIEKDYQGNDEFFIESLKGYPVPVLAKIEYDVLPSFDNKIMRLYLSPRVNP